jgi:hypothetical protein
VSIYPTQSKKQQNILLRVAITLLVLMLLITPILFFSIKNKRVEPAPVLSIPQYPQMPTSPQLVQNISTFRTLPCVINSVINYGPQNVVYPNGYITISLSPNSSTQPNTEYGININYVNTGTLRGQRNEVVPLLRTGLGTN